ncbi:unnamed protein product [Phaedon cochleariae]|uniref:E3 SUMO-protein ligase RanBP2 n=1 Tax=Phaedon cochleariae TaxID=80249 RepID=A0A9N9X1J7_PHACE|nr:unnamed protein product [Phaedon cochleariae]
MKTPAAAQPVLSVTIPPQHIRGGVAKGAATSANAGSPAVSTAAKPQTPTFNPFNSKFPPILSNLSLTEPKNVSLGEQIEKTLEKTFNTSKVSNVSADVSKESVEEYDPCPDFKPIIALPDEVPVTTGEENETVLFCERAKLYRHAITNGVKEWKERGVGSLKILHNPETGKVRVLMRRDQIHKICANHFISKDMSVSPMAKHDRAYIWVAPDFADGEMVTETFCVRFKTAVEAGEFHRAFEDAKKLIGSTEKPEKAAAKEAPKSVPKVETPKITPKIEAPKSASKIEAPKPSSKVHTPNVETPKAGSTLGGFVFTSTPTFKPTEVPKETPAKVVEVQEVPKSSPFSSFTFAGAAQGSLFKPTEPATFSPLVVPQQQQQSKPAKTDADEDDDASHAEEFVPTAEFRPVVAMPDLVEVRTGEENSEVLFEGRAKLFRYDTAGGAKEWKERGVGVMKVLKDDTIRLLMRRDQVHKVCCNHAVIKNMSFKINATNPKAVFWHAQDFSEGVLTPETFTIRFKTEEQASQFLQTLQTAQTSLDENNKVSSKHHKAETRPRTTSFGDKFKPAKGSWECKNCYIVNEGKTNQCVACDTPKSGTSGNKTGESGPGFSFGMKTPEAKPPSAGFLFGQKPATNSWGNAFKPAEGSWECKECYTRNAADKNKCISCEAPKEGTAEVSEKPTLKGINLDTPGLKFTFGMPAVDSQSVKSDAPESKPVAVAKKETSKGINLSTPGQTFTFGVPSSAAAAPVAFGTFNFKAAVVPPQEQQQQSPDDSSKFVFGSPQKHDFEFKARSPRRISSGQGDEESDGSYVEEEEDNIYFKPVIPLPDKVDIKTGEEEEIVLYCHRAKLFRFVGGEWKERGLGDIKILKRKDNGKLRVVMRREQVFKICLNHILTSAIEYIPKDDKSWMFHTADYSEGEIVHTQFCVKFKTPEIAQEFKKAVTGALEGFASGDQAQITASAKQESDDEVELVSETTVTPEEEKEALRLGLPPKFFSYKQLPDCQCEQCKKDDEYLKELFLGDKKTSVASMPDFSLNKSVTTNWGTPKTNLTPSTGDSVFGTPKSNLFTFTPQSQNADSAPVTGKSESLRDLLTKPSLAASLNNTLSKPEAPKESPMASFSFTNTFAQSSPSTVPKIAATTSSSLFGGNTGGLFSNTSLFSSPSFGAGNSSSVNIFGGAVTITPISTSKSGSTSTASSDTPTSTTGTVFGGTSSVFGAKAVVGTTSTTSIFGNNTSLFDSTKTPGSVTTSSTPLFGSTTTPSIFGSTNKSIFGSTGTTTANVFGGGAVTTTAGLFGQNSGMVFGGGSIFSKPAATSVFGASSLGGSGSKPEVDANKSTTELKEDDEVVLKCDTGLSFASLAANTSGDAQPAFSKTGDFSFLGAGAPVFGSASKSSTKKKTADQPRPESDDEAEAAGDGDEYDPHYEPIVPLPAAIVVTTGEEDETAVFNERAKLFRFDADTKAWKERGVGQIKILHHPQNDTYRLLMRREQVHKVVLNQLIVPTLEIQPMLTSEKAWMWVGYNYTDDDNCLENLAVRFKTMEVAQQFHKVITEVIQRVTEIQNNSKSLPTSVQNYGVEDVSSDDPNTLTTAEEYEDYEDEEEEEDDDDDRSVMFMKRCTLSELDNGTWKQVTMGDLQVYYDQELYAARIAVNDDSGNVLSNTLIGINTTMDIDKKECTWKAVEWAYGSLYWRTLKASFSSENAAQEFHSNYLEGLNYAQQVGIVDEIPQEHNPETDE